jgi:hypothetical protein
MSMIERRRDSGSAISFRHAEMASQRSWPPSARHVSRTLADGIVKAHDLPFPGFARPRRSAVDRVVEFGAQPILRILPVLAHHDHRRLSAASIERNRLSE